MSFDEELSEAIRKYPVIYDKGEKGHKDKLKVANAWKKVIEELGLEDVDIAQRQFANLKKLFNKRRKVVTKCGPSGVSRDAVSEAKENMKELAFRLWLISFVQLRTTKSNCPAFKQGLSDVRDHYTSDDGSGDGYTYGSVEHNSST